MLKCWRSSLWSFAIVIGAFLPVQAEALTPNRSTQIHAVQAKAPPVDGSIGDPTGWLNAVYAEGFVDLDSHAPALLRTSSRLLYDRKNIYVDFVCDQDSATLRATQGTNSIGVGQDDNVTFLLDPSGVGTRSYSFSANVNGVRYQTSTESARYAPNWSASVRKSPTKWDVFMVIPLSAIRGQARPKQRWRINFMRHVAYANRDEIWSYDPSADSTDDSVYWPELVDVDIGTKAARPTPRIDVYGLAAAGSDRDRFDPIQGNFLQTQPREAGIDVTVPVTSSLAIVGTLNPDYSNVENDQQSIAPQEFQRVYTEYRPFFSQGAQYLDTTPNFAVNGGVDQPFYSPSLGILDSGLKVEGTVGNASIGALQANGDGFDDKVYNLGYTTPDSKYQANVGEVFADDGSIADNTTSFGFERKNLASGEATQLSFRNEQGTLVTAAGLANEFTASEIIQTSSTSAFLSYKDIGPEYAPIAGYTRVNDAHGPEAFYQYTGSSFAFVKQYSIAGYVDRFVDTTGAARLSDALLYGSITFKNLLSINGGPDTSTLRTYQVGFPTYLGPQTNFFNTHSAGIGYRDGTDSPIDLEFTFGPFASYCSGSPPEPQFCPKDVQGFVSTYENQFDLSGSRAIGKATASAEFDTTLARTATGAEDGQELRRLTLSYSLSKDSLISISLRNISGSGGEASPGTNLGLAYHRRFRSGSDLFFEFGSPNAPTTLHRAILKYVLHIGGGSGT